jgi:hypothetical protein
VALPTTLYTLLIPAKTYGAPLFRVAAIRSIRRVNESQPSTLTAVQTIGPEWSDLIRVPQQAAEASSGSDADAPAKLIFRRTDAGGQVSRRFSIERR